MDSKKLESTETHKLNQTGRKLITPGRTTRRRHQGNLAARRHETEGSAQRGRTSLGSYDRYTKRRQKTVMEHLMASRESKRRGGIPVDETLRLKITHRL